jgi:hypothetical protein
MTNDNITILCSWLLPAFVGGSFLFSCLTNPLIIFSLSPAFVDLSLAF